MSDMYLLALFIEETKKLENMIKFEEGINKWKINRIKFFFKDYYNNNDDDPITTFEDTEGGIITVDTVYHKKTRYHRLILVIFSSDGARITDDLIYNLNFYEDPKNEKKSTCKLFKKDVYRDDKSRTVTVKIEILLKASFFILHCE